MLKCDCKSVRMGKTSRPAPTALFTVTSLPEEHRRPRSCDLLDPRMLLRHPMLAIAHQLDSFRKARHPRELKRAQRLHSRK